MRADAGRDSGADARETSGPDTRDSGGAGDTTGGQVSYANDIAPLLAAKCVSCHGTTVANGGIRLDGYTNAKNNASLANAMIQSGRMPIGGSLTAAEKQLFQSWVNAGTPNN